MGGGRARFMAARTNAIDPTALYQHEWKREDSEISNASSTQHKAESEIHKHKFTTTTTTTTTTMKSSLAAILALGLSCLKAHLPKQMEVPTFSEMLVQIPLF